MHADTGHLDHLIEVSLTLAATPMSGERHRHGDAATGPKVTVGHRPPGGDVPNDAVNL